jgi:alkaline phosphatase
LSVSDRGPNFTVPGKRVFPLPDFTPTIMLLRTEGTSIVPESFLPIVANEQGDPVTGIPNSATEDSVPYRNAADTTPLPFNPNGMDIEDIHTLGWHGFILVDEYSPSIVTVNWHGQVTRRYTPQGKTLAGASYPVSDTLPAVLSQRRANRGFESIAVSPTGRTAYTLTQSPLGSTASGSPYVNSRVVRLLRLDTSDAWNVRVTGQFIVQLSLASTYPAGTRPRDLKISSAAWVSPTKLLLLERSDELLNGVNNGGAKLVLVDFKDATDLHGTALADTLAPEDVSTDFAALGITPATSTVVYSNLETPEIQDFKLEGLAILNPWTVAISNDNDFGIGDFPGATSKIWHIRLGAPLPIW